MATFDDLKGFLATDTGLATVSTTQADGRVLSSIVNCGVIDHPVSGEPRVALVSRGGAARIGHLRRGSEMTIAARRGWNWAAATGPAELIGPNDLPAGFDTDRLRVLLREIFQAAGGTHDDYDEYDQAMIDDGRVAVLVTPDRILGNSPAG